MIEIRRKECADKTLELIEGEVPLLEYPALNNIEGISHCFSTRLGGVSEDIFTSMNLSFVRGDDENKVMENFKRLASAKGWNIEDMVFSDQTHTTNVRVMSSDDRGKGILRARDYADVDGMVTNEPGLILSTFYADCVPLYFVDPVHKAIGLSHSGWKGTVGRIGRVTIETMSREYGTNPEDLVCAIGPSICQGCYEISYDVAARFMDEFPDNIDEILYEKEPILGERKFQLNLWRACEVVLMDAGVKPDNIHTTDICTCCNPELLFSHRASHGKRGNLGAFLCINN